MRREVVAAPGGSLSPLPGWGGHIVLCNAGVNLRSFPPTSAQARFTNIPLEQKTRAKTQSGHFNT